MFGVSLVLTCAGCFGLTAVGAVVPWVNAGVVVLSFTAAAPSLRVTEPLIVVATTGQMGKLWRAP